MMASSKNSQARDSAAFCSARYMIYAERGTEVKRGELIHDTNILVYEYMWTTSETSPSSGRPRMTATLINIDGGQAWQRWRRCSCWHNAT